MEGINRSDGKHSMQTRIVEWIQESLGETVFYQYKDQICDFCCQVVEDE